MNSGRTFIVILGLIAGLLILGQLVMGQMIVLGNASEGLRKAHQHSGYTTVLLALAYIMLSLRVLTKKN